MKRTLAPQPLDSKVQHPFYMFTLKGVVDCCVADFDPSKYKGLKRNCGRPLSPESLKKMKQAKLQVPATTVVV